MGVQKHNKKRFAKKHRVEKLFKKIDQKNQNHFFLDLFLTFLGVSW
jgi:hypothetical protein